MESPETTEACVWAFAPGHSAPRLDQVATEEPLEIRLRAAGLARGRREIPVLYRRGQEGGQRTVAITMRTPGNDFELAAGFLYGEGVVRGAEDIRQVTHCDDPALDDARRYNIVNVDLRRGVLPDLAGPGAPLLHHERVRRMRQGQPRVASTARVSRDRLRTRGATPTSCAACRRSSGRRRGSSTPPVDCTRPALFDARREPARPS